MNYSSHTFRLIKKHPTFIGGFALFDFRGADSKFVMSKTEKQADFEAIKSDWFAVGVDLKSAIKEHQHVDR
jgi:hypothetical protein